MSLCPCTRRRQPPPIPVATPPTPPPTDARPPRPRRPLQLGDAVEVRVGGAWYPGTVFSIASISGRAVHLHVAHAGPAHVRRRAEDAGWADALLAVPVAPGMVRRPQA